MRLLILAYDFPPFISIGGLRPASWFKYLAEFGVDVTVVTWDWEYELERRKDSASGDNNITSVTARDGNKTLVKARFTKGMKETLAEKLNANKFRRIRQALTFVFSFLEFLSIKADPQAPLYCEADKLLQKEKFDFIIATGKPFILFRHAALLSKKYSIPWIADYRDSWTLNHLQSDYSLSPLTAILNTFYKVMERKYVSTARLVTTVASSYIEFLPPFLHPDKIKIIYNGYDDEVESMVKDLPLPKTKFIISYAGIIYPMQNLETFLDGVALFTRENEISKDEFEMHFWGIDENARGRLTGYDAGLRQYIYVHEKVEYFEVMKKLSYSNVLLLLTTASDSWLNAKLFDYLVLKRPVLMIGKKTNLMSGILQETNGGIVAENAISAANYLTSLFKTYKEAGANNTVNYQQYSRKNQAQQFYTILKNLR